MVLFKEFSASLHYKSCKKLNDRNQVRVDKHETRATIFLARYVLFCYLKLNNILLLITYKPRYLKFSCICLRKMFVTEI